MPGFVGLAGRRVLVTGAASGIARAIALRLGGEGVRVGLLDRDAAGAEQVAAAIRADRGDASCHPADISDATAVASAIDAFESDAGGIDGLVNGAGWDTAADFVATTPEDWRRIIDINLYGPLHVTHAVLSRMASEGAGRIVSLASDAGRVGSSGESVYAACKAGIVGFSKSIAREHAKAGITVNIVSPGPTDTPLFENLDPSGRLGPALERAIPMRRLGQPSDYPGIVAFLLSDEAAFITGQTISVSGGLTMHG
ncbi:MAG: SDR family oxidoreductase [Myxococcota bacterium]